MFSYFFSKNIFIPLYKSSGLPLYVYSYQDKQQPRDTAGQPRDLAGQPRDLAQQSRELAQQLRHKRDEAGERGEDIWSTQLDTVLR